MPSDRYVSSYGNLDLATSVKAFVVYGLPRSTTASVESQQSVWIYLGAAIQILTMLAMNYSAYRPLAKLRAVLEEKGFCNRRDRPTLIRVIRVFIVLPIIHTYQDLRSRPLSESIRLYILGG